MRERREPARWRWALIVMTLILGNLAGCAGDGAGVVTGKVDTAIQQAMLSGGEPPEVTDPGLDSLIGGGG